MHSGMCQTSDSEAVPTVKMFVSDVSICNVWHVSFRGKSGCGQRHKGFFLS